MITLAPGPRANFSLTDCWKVQKYSQQLDATQQQVPHWRYTKQGHDYQNSQGTQPDHPTLQRDVAVGGINRQPQRLRKGLVLPQGIIIYTLPLPCHQELLSCLW